MVDLSKLGTLKKITAEEMTENIKGFGQEQSRDERRQEEKEREKKAKAKKKVGRPKKVVESLSSESEEEKLWRPKKHGLDYC
jgi:hypothetical protein